MSLVKNRRKRIALIVVTCSVISLANTSLSAKLQSALNSVYAQKRKAKNKHQIKRKERQKK